ESPSFIDRLGREASVTIFSVALAFRRSAASRPAMHSATGLTGDAGDWQGVPRLVRARQRGARRKRDGSRVSGCMGLSSGFVIFPPPSGLIDRADDCLAAGVDMHVLDGYFLLPLSSIALQCFGLDREGAKELHSEITIAVLLGYRVRAFQTAQCTCRREMR